MQFGHLESLPQALGIPVNGFDQLGIRPGIPIGHEVARWHRHLYRTSFGKPNWTDSAVTILTSVTIRT